MELKWLKVQNHLNLGFKFYFEGLYLKRAINLSLLRGEICNVSKIHMSDFHNWKVLLETGNRHIEMIMYMYISWHIKNP